MSEAGDVDRDGYADVLVGAYAYDSGQTDEGKVFAWHGGAYSANPAVRFDKHSPERGRLFPPIKWQAAGS